MVVFNIDEYKLRRDAFNREYKRVEPYKTTTSDGKPKEPRRELTKNLQLIEEYKESLSKTYNDLINYLHSVFEDPQTTPEDELEIQNKAIEIRIKLNDSFNCLNLEYKFEAPIFSEIDISKIIETQIDDETDNQSESDVDNNSKQTTVVNEKNTNKSQPEIPIQTNNTINDLPEDNDTSIMTQTSEKFMAIANSTINYRYSGDPLGLDTFIDGIELLDELCEEQNKQILLRFLKTRLEGRARELINNEQ